MARKTIVHVVDDLNGSPNAAPIMFSVNGENYRIDLNKRNTDTFMRRLDKYVTAAKPVKASRRRKGNPANRAIREWALANGYTIGDRGRISAGIQTAYRNRNTHANV